MTPKNRLVMSGRAAFTNLTREFRQCHNRLQIGEEWQPAMARSVNTSDGSSPPPGAPADSSRGSVRGTLRRVNLNSVQVQLLIGTAIVAGVFGFLYPDRFATWRNVENMARQGGTLAVVAIGQSFALISGGFDISVAATMGLASTLGAMAMIEYGVAAGVAAGLAAGIIVGLLNGTLIAHFGVTPFIATLGMLAIARGVANEVSDGRSVSGIPASFDWFGGGNWGLIPATVGMAIVAYMLASFFLYRTRPGLYLYATGGSESASRLSGVNVTRAELSAYVLCSFLAAVGGLMLASRVSVGQASLGQGFELMSIATAVIGGVAIGGGVGRLSGVVLGVVLVSVLSTGMNIAQLSEFTQEIVTGVVLIAAVVIDRVRLLGLQRRRVESVLHDEQSEPTAA